MQLRKLNPEKNQDFNGAHVFVSMHTKKGLRNKWVNRFSGSQPSLHTARLKRLQTMYVNRKLIYSFTENLLSLSSRSNNFVFSEWLFSSFFHVPTVKPTSTPTLLLRLRLLLSCASYSLSRSQSRTAGNLEQTYSTDSEHGQSRIEKNYSVASQKGTLQGDWHTFFFKLRKWPEISTKKS